MASASSCPELKCPSCTTRLDEIVAVQGALHTCTKCSGTLLGTSILTRLASRETIAQLWEASVAGGKKSLKPCPRCSQAMTEFHCNPNEIQVELDLCYTCSHIWFDRDELSKVPAIKNEEIRPPTPAEIHAQQLSRSKAADISSILDIVALILLGDS